MQMTKTSHQTQTFHQGPHTRQHVICRPVAPPREGSTARCRPHGPGRHVRQQQTLQ